MMMRWAAPVVAAEEKRRPAHEQLSEENLSRERRCRLSRTSHAGCMQCMMRGRQQTLCQVGARASCEKSNLQHTREVGHACPAFRRIKPAHGGCRLTRHPAAIAQLWHRAWAANWLGIIRPRACGAWAPLGVHDVCVWNSMELYCTMGAASHAPNCAMHAPLLLG